MIEQPQWWIWRDSEWVACGLTPPGGQWNNLFVRFGTKPLSDGPVITWSGFTSGPPMGMTNGVNG